MDNPRDGIYLEGLVLVRVYRIPVVDFIGLPRCVDAGVIVHTPKFRPEVATWLLDA